MNPQEKALYLFIEVSNNMGTEPCEAITIVNVLLDELINLPFIQASNESRWLFKNHIEYWQEVKKEVEKLKNA